MNFLLKKCRRDVATLLFINDDSMGVQIGKATLDSLLARYLGWSGLTQLAAGMTIWCTFLRIVTSQFGGQNSHGPSFPKMYGDILGAVVNRIES